ncbi:MAG: trimeric intracellular cation channel family protein [Lentisphaeria bacterium]|nr:trimeric intracellular cation channel family protein [Lentisphaeria bacterium]
MNLGDPSFQQNLIYLFDVIGTIIFAVTGGVRGVRLKLDLLGVIVFACTVGVGGGMIRDALIGYVPVASFRNGIYLFSCIMTGLIVFFLSPLIQRRRNLIQIFDAFGLGVFTAIGAAKGVESGLALPGVVLCGVITAVGGGVIRDIMSTRIPAVLTSDFYATASLLGALLYLALLPFEIPFFWMFMFVMIFVTGIRLLAIHYKVRLPISGGRVASILFRRHGKKNQKL